MTEQLDTHSEAREALRSAVADFGQRVLSDPRMLRSRMSDLLPDLPKERDLLVTAAEADVAGALTRHVQQQRLDPDTAVQLVAGTLTDRRSIDPAASMWVASEYAQALGYPVRSDVPPPTPPSPGPTPAPQETITAYPQYGSPYQGTAPQQDPTIGAPVGYGGYYSQPQAPAEGGGYGGYYSQPQTAAEGGGYGGYYSQPQAPAGGQVPPAGPSQGPVWVSPRPAKRRNRGLIYGLGAGAAAVVILVVAAFAGGLFTSNAKPAPAPTVGNTHKATPSPKPSANGLAPGVAPLVQLLPSDVNPTNCKAAVKPGWAIPGLVQSLQCTDSGVGSGYDIYAYQMDSSANYAASWANFNTWWGFSAPSGSGCAPAPGDTQGSVPWDDTGSGGNGFYPAAAGQILECGLLGSNGNQPTYAWSFPSEDAYIIAIANPNTSFSALDSWWTNNSDPNSAPKPATP